MTSDVNKYHIVPLWTGFYFSDTWGCQATAVHHSGNLRSLPWSLWPEFLRRRWKKKLPSQTCSVLWEENALGFLHAEHGKQRQWRVLGWQLGRVSVVPFVWWLWLPQDIAEVQMAAHSCNNITITRCRCSRLARYQSSFHFFCTPFYYSLGVVNCPLSI